MSWQTVDIDIDAQEIVEKIPTSILEEELKDRKELQASDIKASERAERGRTSNIDWEIDPDDYNLVDRDNITLADFDNDKLIDYLENNGYEVFDKDGSPDTSLDGVIKYFENKQPYKLKEFLCDLCQISHLSSKEQIIKELLEKF